MSGEYYKTKESVKEYIRLAKGFNGKELIEQLKPVLPKSATVLELGSGPGSDWEILSENYLVTGSDNSIEFLSHLIKQYPNHEFLELDASTLKTEKAFDGVYSNKVLHHLSDDSLNDSVKRQHAVLNSDGIICHSFWKGESSEIFKGLFVNYHTEESLRKTFNTHFEIISLESYAEFEEGDSLLLIARKNS